MPAPPDVRHVEQDLTRRLLAWAAGSLLVGGIAWRRGSVRDDTALRALGVQTVLWGAVDAGIAGVGVVKRRSEMSAPDAAGLEEKRRRLRRLLLVNAGLDVGYVTAGLLLVRGRGAQRLPHVDEEALPGHGAAVVVQGLALLVLDVTHARRLASP